MWQKFFITRLCRLGTSDVQRQLHPSPFKDISVPKNGGVCSSSHGCRGRNGIIFSRSPGVGLPVCSCHFISSQLVFYSSLVSPNCRLIGQKVSVGVAKVEKSFLLARRSISKRGCLLQRDGPAEKLPGVLNFLSSIKEQSFLFKCSCFLEERSISPLLPLTSL